MGNEKKLRWGILGYAGIAKNQLIPAIQKSKLGEVTAISSRDQTKAEAAAKQLGITKGYGSYEALLKDPEVDAVYIPLPNHLHKEWTIRAAEHGKHVLCEKPIGLNADEAIEMKVACEKAGVKLAEAFMYRHHPRYKMIKDYIKSGRIGELRSIRGAFTYNKEGAYENVRFQKAMGGGALYDVGCYPINAARYLFEQEPSAVSISAVFSDEYDGVDTMASGVLEFPNGLHALLQCGMLNFGENVLEIIGSKGKIEVPDAFGCGADESAHFFIMSKTAKEEIEVPHVHQYILQVDDFAESVLQDRPVKFSPTDAVDNMKALDACYLSAREKRRVELIK